MSNTYQVRLTTDLQDLTPILAGTSICSADTYNTPRPPTYTLLHYVTQDSGYFSTKGASYEVKAGQAFLIHPGESASFHSSSEDPWALRWVGFHGKLAHRFAALPAVFDVPQEVRTIFCDPSDPNISNNTLSYRIAAELMLLHAMLLEPIEKKPDYVHLVMEHIQNFHHQKLSVASIADSLGLNRCYLSDLFKKKTGMSIREYLLKTRLYSSKEYLLKGSSVKEAALRSGFSDVSNYIKHFVRLEGGLTPTQFRKNAINGAASFLKNNEKP